MASDGQVRDDGGPPDPRESRSLFMPLVLTLVTLGVAVAATWPLSRALGRRAGFVIAGLYLIAAAVFAPAVQAVLRGELPAWSMPWIPGLGVDLALRADGIGVVFSLIALIIGALVLAYAAVYLPRDGTFSFLVLMSGFTLAMVGLVLADDLFLLFVCWELTSLASFFLIARSGRAGEAASMRTLLLTFIGGLFLLAAIGLMVWRTGTTTLSEALAHPVWGTDPAYASIVAVLVALAGFSKAAQFPFHVWLPDAMAAPTPVSAYLHAAAVVKAGIFLMMRFTPAFADVPVWNGLLIVTGLTTGFIGARFALAQTDLKRLMAYSTVSQLGLITATIGVGTEAALAAATLHTIAHALFKSGLFMMVGIIDHASHTRDLRRLPQLYRALPVSFILTIVGCASMAGLPPLLGFVSKEALLTGLFHATGPDWVGWLALAGATIVSILTFTYCGKILVGGFIDGRDARPVDRVEAGLVWPAAIPILVGLPLGLGAFVFDTPVARAVEAALPASDPQPHFSLWHGVTPELLATIVIIGVGTVLVFSRRRWLPRAERPFPFDGPAVIARTNRGLRRLGLLAAKSSLEDIPVRHLAPIAAVLAGVLLGGVAAISDTVPPAQPGLARPLDVVILVLLVAAVFGVCLSRARLSAVVSLSAVGILATVQILSLGAPDVALTQLLVESLTVIVIMLVLQRLPLAFAEPSRVRETRAVILALAGGLAAGLATWAFTGRRGRSDVAEYLIAESNDLTGGTNIVNLILVEFRALDTMGELAVLGMAGVAIIAILSTVRSSLMDPEPEEDPNDATEAQPALREPGSTAYRSITEAWANVVPLRLMVRFLTPVLAVTSALIFLRGHNAPGGGFIAALVGSCIVALVYLSTSRDRQVGPPRLPLWLIGGGILIAVGMGFWGLLAKGSFLEPLHGYVLGTHFSSSMVFDVGVYTAVLGLIIVAFNLLGTGAGTARDPEGERTRERADEIVEGELEGPLDTVRGERPPKVGMRTRIVTDESQGARR